METVNENVKQPSYEELQNAYQIVLNKAQEYERGYQVLLQDRTLEKIKVVGNIIEHSDVYPKSIIKLAEWHLKQMLAKPKA